MVGSIPKLSLLYFYPCLLPDFLYAPVWLCIYTLCSPLSHDYWQMSSASGKEKEEEQEGEGRAQGGGCRGTPCRGEG